MQQKKNKKMHYQQKVMCEISTRGQIAKEEAVKKIESLLDENPGSLKLNGNIVTATIPGGKPDTRVEVGMEKPTIARIRSQFDTLPESDFFEGILILTVSEGFR